MSNILIIKHGSLGDLIQANGAIKDIKNFYKNRKVFLLTSQPYAIFMSECPYIDGVIIDCKFKSRMGTIHKKIIFDNKNSKIGIKYKIELKKNINGSIRLNHITLNPKIFKSSLYYKTNNGGNTHEKFSVGKENFDHGESVSHLITANQAVGITKNTIYFGDKSKNICINIDRNFDNQVGMLSFKKIYKKRFFRLCFSVKEHDDTSKINNAFKAETLTWISSNLEKK